MTSRDLLALHECKRKYKLQTMHLKGGNEKSICFGRALQLLAEGIAKGDEKHELMQQLADYLKAGYKENWFLLDWQKERAVKKDCHYLERFLKSYLIENKWKIITDFFVEVKAGFECNEVAVETVHEKADLLIQDEDGYVTGVILCRKFVKPYSYYARREDHQVMSSVEMLVLMEGLIQKFPGRKIRVQMIRMVAPSDTADDLALFEKKKGENIVEFTNEEFLAAYPKGILPRLQEILQKPGMIHCDECQCQEMCQKTNLMYRKKTDGDSAPKKRVAFSESQKEIVHFEKGPLCVCATPGSGKTAVLVGRVKHLIETGVLPQRILAITFTRKAAQEMAERIALDNGPVVCTMHSLAFHILTKHEYLVGKIRLASTVDCKYLLLKILNHAPVIKGANYERLTVRFGLIDSLLKDFAHLDTYGKEQFIETFPRKDAEGILAVKQMYDEAFRGMGYITYDDQIGITVDLLKKYPGILEAVRDAFDHILVDEAQDLNEAQAELVKLLVRPPQNNLVIFGDADQAIYGFRGGSNQFLLDFLDIYPDAHRLNLCCNYRSSKEVVELANALIAKNQNRIPISMKAEVDLGYKPVYIPGFYMIRMVELIQEIRKKGYEYQDIAVIARTNKELENICTTLNRRAAEEGVIIPFGRPKYYLRQDFVFQTLLDLLQLKVAGMEQDKPLYRLLSAMGCQVIKKKRSSIYEEHLKEKAIYDFEGSEASRYYLEEEDPLVRAYGRIYKALQKWELPIKQALEELQAELFSENLCTEEVFERLKEMVYEKKLSSYEQLYECMRAMRIFSDDTRVYYKEADKNRVHMLTAHDVKGKEFPVVILNMDEFESRESEEERRTLYVAITRAKRALFLLESYPGKSGYLMELSEYITINRRKRYEQ